jgi:hypothetical protein
MEDKVTRRKARKSAGPPQTEAETPAEVSRMAGLAGLRMSEEDAAWVSNKLAQRRAASDAVRRLDYHHHEPAATFAPPRHG